MDGASRFLLDLPPPSHHPPRAPVGQDISCRSGAPSRWCELHLPAAAAGRMFVPPALAQLIDAAPPLPRHSHPSLLRSHPPSSPPPIPPLRRRVRPLAWRALAIAMFVPSPSVYK